MSWLPDQVIKCQEQDAQYKWYDGQVFIGILPEQGFGVEMKKFTDHPVTVGTDPKRDRNVMTQFTHVLACSPGNHNRYDQCRKDHGNAQWSPDHAPGYVFKQPEYDVQVFHFAVTQWNIINRFICHTCEYINAFA